MGHVNRGDIQRFCQAFLSEVLFLAVFLILSPMILVFKLSFLSKCKRSLVGSVCGKTCFLEVFYP